MFSCLVVMIVIQKHKILGVKNTLIIPPLSLVGCSRHNCPKEQKGKWSTLVKTALKSFLNSFLIVVFGGDEAVRRGILWGFILQYLSMTGGEHCPFALSVFPNLWQLLRICRKSCALLWTQISCKIKYYFYQYHYFLGRVNQLLQAKSSCSKWRNSDLFPQRATDRLFLGQMGRSINLSTSAVGRRKKVAAKRGSLPILSECSAYL